MSDVYGNDGFFYKYVDGWDKLPEGWSFRDCPSVGVDSQDNVYVITRGKHPIIVTQFTMPILDTRRVGA